MGVLHSFEEYFFNFATNQSMLKLGLYLCTVFFYFTIIFKPTWVSPGLEYAVFWYAHTITSCKKVFQMAMLVSSRIVRILEKFVKPVIIIIIKDGRPPLRQRSGEFTCLNIKL